MKKFFRALALLLALVLVIGTIPVSAAASDFEIVGDKDGKKIIYLGNAQGEKTNEDGTTTKCPSKDRYKLSKLVQGFDPDTMDIKLVSEDKTIATTSNKYDRVYAKGIGTTKVDIIIYNKSTDEEITRLSIKVQVKKNADAVKYSVAEADGTEVKVSEQKLGVAIPYTFTLTRRDAEGNLTDTDKRSLTCVDSEGKDIEGVKIEQADPKKPVFTVTFDKAGSFVLKANAFQSKKFNKILISEDIKVTVGYEAVDVAQKALDTATVTFNTKVTNLKPESFRAYWLSDDENKKEMEFSPASHVVVDSEDPTKAYVQFFSNFTEGREYFVQYDGVTIGSFTAIVVTADSVASIVIPAGQTFGKGDPAKLAYSLLNKDGIDITKAKVLYDTGRFELTFVKDEDNFTNDITYDDETRDVELTLNTVGEYQVKARFVWYDSNAVEQPVEATQTITCKAVAWDRGTVTGVVRRAPYAKYIKEDGSIDGNVGNQTWAIGDCAGDTAYLYIAVPYTKNGKTINEGFGVIYDNKVNVNGKEIDGPLVYESYKVESANEKIIMIGNFVGDANSTSIELIANKDGKTNIIVKGVYTKDYKEYEEVIGVIPVEVLSRRAAKSFKVNPNAKKINLAYYGDSIGFEFTVLDQHGEEMAGRTVTVTQVIDEKSLTDPKYRGPIFDGPAWGTTAVRQPWENPNEWYLTPWDIYTNFTIDEETSKLAQPLKLKFACDGLEQTVILDVGFEAVRKELNLTLSGTSLDTGLDRDSWNGDIKVSLAGKTKSGYNTYGADITFSFNTPADFKKDPSLLNDYGVATGAALRIYNVYYNNKLISKTDDMKYPWGAWNGIANNFWFTSDDDYDLIFKKANVDTVEEAVVSGGAIIGYQTKVVTGATITKIESGTYRIEGYEIQLVDGKIKVTPLGKQQFTVTDSQKQLEVITLDNAEKLANIDDENVASAFIVKFNGEEVTSFGGTLEYQYTEDGNGNAYVKKVVALIPLKNIEGLLRLEANIDKIVRTEK